VTDLTAQELGAEALAPDDPAWNAAEAVRVPLVPVPVDAQPNAYIRAAWHDRSYGATPSASVAVATHGDRLFVRLEWDGSGPVAGEFPDACAVLFPAGDGPDTPVTMGDHASPVEVWQWRDRLPVQEAIPAVRHLVSTGPGMFRPGAADADLAAAATVDGTRWSVVLAGPRSALGAPARVAVAVWNGANEERAGIGAVSDEWAAVQA
jgi:DMSO reductase family type II enzyme heme b subunit